MAAIEKSYTHPPAVLWNLINDIVEMRKGRVRSYDAESMTVDTEMYGIVTSYTFRVVHSPPETKVAVETEGDGEDEMRGVELMFSTLENLLLPFAAT